uniref:SURP motif domain-containing protein n=1 Tax=Oryzias sinensis TaxID=183150 RepID=A0A8C7WY28_9TELE
MDIPNPPEDQELRNVIDKLAQFVARNGPEFEKMTMDKQKDNPKFSFLFGGEFFSYYKCKLALEQQQRGSFHDDDALVELCPPPLPIIQLFTSSPASLQPRTSPTVQQKW